LLFLRGVRLLIACKQIFMIIIAKEKEERMEMPQMHILMSNLRTINLTKL
jgi:hypothetical protein